VNDDRSTVKVTVEVRNANGKDTDVSVKEFIRWGNDIPALIDKTAKEASALAYKHLGSTVDRTR
jgi:hypothetical protein